MAGQRLDETGDSFGEAEADRYEVRFAELDNAVSRQFLRLTGSTKPRSLSAMRMLRRNTVADGFAHAK